MDSVKNGGCNALKDENFDWVNESDNELKTKYLNYPIEKWRITAQKYINLKNIVYFILIPHSKHQSIFFNFQRQRV